MALDQVDRFHAQWRDFVVPLIFQKARITDVAAAPRFVYQEEGTSIVARRVLIGCLGLIAPAAVMAWVGLHRLRRYPMVD